MGEKPVEYVGELDENKPDIDVECPDCGGRVQVWLHHTGDVGMTQMVRHIPPEKEDN